MNYQQELTDKVKENYISIAIGFLVFLVAVALIFKSNNKMNQMDAEKEAANQEAMMEAKNMYTVKAGDTVSKISLAQYGTMDYTDDIIKLNDLKNPNSIEVGMKLKLPEAQKAAPTEAMKPAATAAPTMAPKTGTTMETGKGMTGKISITGDFYIVKKGDHLWSIAERAYGNGEKWTVIAKANNLKNADDITEGMKLKLPR